jgi:hypothetical protein
MTGTGALTASTGVAAGSPEENATSPKPISPGTPMIGMPSRSRAAINHRALLA